MPSPRKFRTLNARQIESDRYMPGLRYRAFHGIAILLAASGTRDHYVGLFALCAFARRMPRVKRNRISDSPTSSLIGCLACARFECNSIISRRSLYERTRVTFARNRRHDRRHYETIRSQLTRSSKRARAEKRTLLGIL